MSVIEIENLTFGYDKETILENISLRVEERDFLAIIGPNGGGKSTLLKLILGILKTRQGIVKVLGEKPYKNLSTIGYAPQNTNINTDFPIRVIEVVMMGHIEAKRPLFGYGESEKTCAIGSLAQVGMEKFANQKIGSLSGGQRQRVMIARALCSHPRILLLDEPTASIDVKGQREIYELLKELHQRITVVVVTHDISVILEYANKVAHINKTLSFHDISNTRTILKPQNPQEHFCEVELMQMLGTTQSKTKEIR